MRRLTSLVVSLGLSLALGGCSKELSQIVVVVDSNLLIGEEITSVDIVAIGPAGEEARTEASLIGAGSRRFPLTLGLVAGDEERMGPVTVRAIGKLDGVEVIEQHYDVAFVKGEERMLTLTLLYACINVQCGSSETCVDMVCVDAARDAGTMPPYSPRRAMGSFGRGTTEPSCIQTQPTETCNGRDDDCDGTTDELEGSTDPGSLTDANVYHCGECENRCPAPFATAPTCDGGTCGVECIGDGSTPLHYCPMGCSDSRSSLHCGAECEPCPDRARASATCRASGETHACGYTCDAGFADCDGLADNGCETDLSRAESCGACASAGAEHVCDTAHPTNPELCSGTAATGFRCVDTCDTGLVVCGTMCVDTQTSSSHCGACDSACGAEPANGSMACVGGDCVASCDTGYHLCGEVCVADSSVDGCGTTSCERCPDKPNAAPICRPTGGGYECAFTCLSGYDDCNGDPADGCEVRLDSLTDCGSCGQACARAHATATCAGGTCGVASCEEGWGDCDGSALTGCESSLFSVTHCGACGATCAAPPSHHRYADCSSGTCQIGGCLDNYYDCNGLPNDGCEHYSTGGFLLYEEPDPDRLFSGGHEAYAVLVQETCGSHYQYSEQRIEDWQAAYYQYQAPVGLE